MTIAPPPTGTEIVYAKRVSPTLPTGPTLDAFGRPTSAFTETSTLVEDWGRFQVTFGTEDVTFLRGVPCEVVSYSSSEPFGDETAVIRFPQISPFDELGVGDLASFADWVDVTINRVYWSEAFNEERVDTDWAWYGLWVSQDVERTDDSAGTTFHCVGVLYEADFRIATPSLDPVSVSDVTNLIFDRLNDTSFRFGPPTIPFPATGIDATDLGAYQQLLTGLIQDYLAMAYDPTSGDQWTVTNLERDCEIVLKDTSTVHWTVSAAAKGLSFRLSRDLSMMPKAIYGSGFSPEDGCEWRNAFYPGLTSGSLTGFFIAPLDVETEVEPYLYDVNGEVTGANPSYDPDVVRVEKYENFGRIDKGVAGGSASFEIQREGEGGGPAYTGTITLRVDPQEGSRWEIKAGQNIQLNDVRTFNLLFHIARVEANPEAGTVTLTVDTKARDLPTLGAIEQRRKDQTDLVRRNRPTRNTSRMVIDRVVPWDCESGAGVVPSTAVPALSWAVVRIAVGSRGDVAEIDLQASSAVELSVGIFDRPILPAELLAAGTPADDDYWDYDNWDETSGLVQAVGAGDDLGGYGMMSAADDAAVLTGRLQNDQSFPYVSTQPPWLWVALWATSAVDVEGLLRPGPQGSS